MKLIRAFFDSIFLILIAFAFQIYTAKQECEANLIQKQHCIIVAVPESEVGK